MGDCQENTHDALEEALAASVNKGSPQLQDESPQVNAKSETHDGYFDNSRGSVTFSFRNAMGGRWETTSSIVSYHWALKDYGDQLSREHAEGDLKGDLTS